MNEFCLRKNHYFFRQPFLLPKILVLAFQLQVFLRLIVCSYKPATHRCVLAKIKYTARGCQTIFSTLVHLRHFLTEIKRLFAWLCLTSLCEQAEYVQPLAYSPAVRTLRHSSRVGRVPAKLLRPRGTFTKPKAFSLCDNMLWRKCGRRQ
jgi:hypothetical protein